MVIMSKVVTILMLFNTSQAMMKNKFLYLLSALMIACVFASCDDENYADINFTCSSEVPEADATADAKNYLSMERYVYWEDGDKVAIFSSPNQSDNCATDDAHFRIDVPVTPRPENPRYADFSAYGFASNDNYYGVSPSVAAVSGHPKQFQFPSMYTYREDKHADFSYCKPGLPMVAWSNGADVPELEFHAICGVARIQLTTSSTSPHTISKIVFTECGSAHGMGTSPISGVFTVNDMETYNPSVKPASSNSSSGTTITIKDIKKDLTQGTLLTFYLPLPATDPSELNNKSTTFKDYALKMSVYCGGSDPAFEKSFAVKIRRNGLSYLPAISIDNWSSNGNITTGLVGCGTELRPFQIYTVEDLQKVRDAFAAPGTPKINGQEVTANTYFKVVSSSISLTTTNWTSGISNFKGHFTYSAGNYTNVGITNNSGKPIFQSVSSEGIVEGLYVKGDYTGSNAYAGPAFSPLCDVNNGVLNNCHCLCRLYSASADLAGVCVTNNKTITNASTTSTITTGGKAAGICLTNSATGTIECYTITTSKATGSQAAGVCHTNNGMIQNSQVTSSRSDVDCPYGGIVYMNNPGATIKNCQIYGSLISTQQIGGICHTNKGNVDYCQANTSLLRGSERVGGIVAYQTGGEIRNCFNGLTATANVTGNAASIVGGLVGYMDNGKVTNCYCTLETQSAGATYFGSIVGQVRGGAIANCYNSSTNAHFYGDANTTYIKENCFNPSTKAGCCVFDRTTGSVSSATSASITYTGATINNYLKNYVVGHSGSGYLDWTEPVQSAPYALPTLIPSGTKIGRRR